MLGMPRRARVCVGRAAISDWPGTRGRWLRLATGGWRRGADMPDGADGVDGRLQLPWHRAGTGAFDLFSNSRAHRLWLWPPSLLSVFPPSSAQNQYPPGVLPSSPVRCRFSTPSATHTLPRAGLGVRLRPAPRARRPHNHHQAEQHADRTSPCSAPLPRPELSIPPCSPASTASPSHSFASS